MPTRILLITTIGLSLSFGAIAAAEPSKAADAKLACSEIWSQMASRGLKCRSGIKPRELIEIVTQMQKSSGQPVLIFDVFTVKYAPKSFKEFTDIPNDRNPQTYTLKVDRGSINEQYCYKNNKKVNCGF